MVECELSFQMKFETKDSESVRIIGNIQQFGNWDPQKGLKLIRNENDPLIWISKTPLILLKGTKLEFKFIVMDGETVKRWEKFTNDANRKYKIKYLSVILKGAENDEGGKEIIEKREEEDNKKNLFSPKIEKKNIKKPKDSFFLEENPIIIRPKISEIYPFSFAGRSDDDSGDESEERASFLENVSEITNHKNLELSPEDAIQEITNSNSSDSFELEPIDSKTKHEIKLADLYIKLKSKVFESSKSPTKNPSPKKNYYIHSNSIKSQTNSEKILLVISQFLPLKVIKTEKGINVELISHFYYDQFITHALRLNNKNFLFMGMLIEDIEPNDQNEISKLIKDKFNCICIFKPKTKFELNNGLSFLDYLFFNSEITKFEESTKISNEKSSLWNTLIEINNLFLKEISLLNLDPSTKIFLSDYHLCLLPKILRENSFKFRIAFFFNSNFPSYEVFYHFNYKDELLSVFLYSDMLYFNDFDHARPLLSVLLIYKNISYGCKNGLLFFEYEKKEINIRLKSYPIDSYYYENIIKDKEFQKKTKNIIKFHEKKNLVFSFDFFNEISALELKLTFFKTYLEETKNKYNLKLIQIIKTKDNSKLNNIENLSKKFNENLGYEAIYLINFDKLSENEVLQYISASKLMLDSSIKHDYSFLSQIFIIMNKCQGLILISEFLNYNKSCKSILQYNPFKYNDFKSRMDTIFSLDHQLIKILLTNDITFLLKHNISQFFQIIQQDLDQNPINFSIQPNYFFNSQILDLVQLKNSYINSHNRIIFLDFEEILLTNKIESSLIKLLNIITQDQRNTLFILSDKNVEILDNHFGHWLNIGLAAEYGYLYKPKGKLKWSNLFISDWSWKEVAKKIMENYCKNTSFSTLEFKESCLRWNFKDSPPELAHIQAKSLKKHLQSSLEYHPEIEIFEGKDFIETRPLSIRKGIFAKLVIKKLFLERGKIDFLLCLGNSDSEKELLERVRHIFDKKKEFFQNNTQEFIIKNACNSSFANYFVNGPNDIRNMLQILQEN